jgi:hypothetical protein
MTPVSAPVSAAAALEHDDQQMIAWAWREPS